LIDVLLLTGQNNHDWERSAPFCRTLLEETGLFRVTVSEHPATALADAGQVESRDLFFLDYRGPDWGEPARTNFVSAVRRGAGVFVLHAANNAFSGWVEYEEICALLWRKGSAHGSYHRFDVRLVDQEHPVTRGLPTVLEGHPDELYHGLVHMHDAPYKLLATAFSSTESGGTGRDEPVLIARDYGEGRVFHCILGHVWKGAGMETFESPDFQRVLLRGSEWAASGEVTL
jgi:type 1 glutamine amidotransferase